MALVVIVGMWVVVGMVSLARRRAERGSTSSIGDFRRQLRVIGRTGPELLVTPANRLRVPRPSATVVTFPGPQARRPSGPTLVSPSGWTDDRGGGGQPGFRRPLGGQDARRPARRTSLASIPTRDRAPRMVGTDRGLGRQRTLERRRNVLIALVSLTIVAAFIAAVSGAQMMWALAAIGALVLVGYVALLIRMRNRAAERDLKLSFLPPPRQVAPELALRRSAIN